MNDECGMHRVARVAHDRHYNGADGNWYNNNTPYEVVNYD